MSRRNAKFDFGSAPMPYYPDVAGAPQNSIIGGAWLWVMGGKKPEEYKGVAKFFTFLSNPDVQAAVLPETGYLPITKAAFETKTSRLLQEEPGHRHARSTQMTNKTDREFARPRASATWCRSATSIDEEMEEALAGKKTAKQALDSRDARQRLLERFEKANKD